MVVVIQYRLPPTPPIPNSPLLLLHYPAFLSDGVDDSKHRGRSALDLLTANGWLVQWLVRYGPTQQFHYHSHIHERMAVLSGSATIRFGTVDSTADENKILGMVKDENSAQQPPGGSIEVQANAGDVFIIPAGVAHKTYDPLPRCAFRRLTPGDGHDDVTGYIAKLFSKDGDSELDGFTMLGTYPNGHGTWDFAVGCEHEGAYDQVRSTARPTLDPVLGTASEGLCGLWY